jgi:hypothetical protein
MSGLSWATIDAIQAQSPAVRRNRAALLNSSSEGEGWLAQPTDEDKRD